MPQKKALNQICIIWLGNGGNLVLLATFRYVKQRSQLCKGVNVFSVYFYKYPSYHYSIKGIGEIINRQKLWTGGISACTI